MNRYRSVQKADLNFTYSRVKVPKGVPNAFLKMCAPKRFYNRQKCYPSTQYKKTVLVKSLI